MHQHHHSGEPAHAHGAPEDPERWQRMFERQQARSHLIWRWLEALQVRPGTVLADIGAGPGLASLTAARMAGPTGRIYAVDSEPGALEFLRQRWQEQHQAGVPLAPVFPVVADAARVTLPEPVDALLVTHMLHHAADPQEVLRRCRALVRPGGRAVVAEFDPQAPGAFGPPRERRIPRALLQAWLHEAGWLADELVTDQEEQYAWRLRPAP